MLGFWGWVLVWVGLGAGPRSKVRGWFRGEERRLRVLIDGVLEAWEFGG